MILGNLCTRGCGFCSVPKGNPRLHDMGLDPAEHANVALIAAATKLRYVVIKSVNRDDLADGGSAHFAETVREVKRALPVALVLDAGPDVFNHNMETVPRLHRRVRPQADYWQSLDELRFARSHLPEVLTKSGFMVGLREMRAEVEQGLRDLRDHEVDVNQYREFGLSPGFKMAFSGPLVRSSYMADLVIEQAARA